MSKASCFKKELLPCFFCIHATIDWSVLACLPGSGNAGSNVRFNSKHVQQELQRLDAVLADLVQTEKSLITISSPENGAKLMQAIQSVNKQLFTCDILENVANALEAHLRLEEQQDEVHKRRSERQAMVWVAEAEMNSLKARAQHAEEQRSTAKRSYMGISRTTSLAIGLVLIVLLNVHCLKVLLLLFKICGSSRKSPGKARKAGAAEVEGVHLEG